ncbi:cyclic nucleotide-binding protein [Thalassotalea litorea]|uniref:Cyclic nucleotide-binding protein n=1 Tax=Thalassotalea litorea TaxID=2020715 RepID=A0A5R9IEP2_9GAMM|nr:polysaccharide lyase family 7 protein [Thalassotalea litorea]TLU61843.1 cyclic nucleotide-binding protein [Thalassotalea litorea]
MVLPKTHQLCITNQDFLFYIDIIIGKVDKSQLLEKQIMKRFTQLVFFSLISLFITGCNSSSEPEKPVDKTPVEQTPVETQEVICSPLARLPTIAASASAELESNAPSFAIDGQFLVESQWRVATDNQEIVLTLDKMSLVKGLSILWDNPDQRSYSFEAYTSQDEVNWVSVLAPSTSDPQSNRAQYTQLSESTAKYIKLVVLGNSIDTEHGLIEIESFGCVSSSASQIELADWYLSIPVDENLYSKAKSIKEDELKDGYFNHEFFFEDIEGGLVFRAPVSGAKTSSNTKYTRTELREMLRRGDTSISTQGVNENNWVFSSAPQDDLDQAGGIDGELYAELEVNHVTTTGEQWQIGRVIIGQIHANDDEPIRVYYRKLPDNERGSIYLAHEILGGDDIYFEVLGNRSQSADNPVNGIGLEERFAYRIKVIGNELTFTLIREGQDDIRQIIDMTDSGYDQGGQYMYFKAGVYNQNNTGEAQDYVEATFYKIDNSH